MTAILIENMGGMIPRLSDRLLPNEAASLAENVKLLSGELRGLARPKFLKSFPAGTARAYRIPDPGQSDVWVGFDNADVDMVRGPLVNDAFDRYYWSDGQGRLQYNTLARLRLAQPSYDLGVTRPTTAPTLNVTGGSLPDEPRAYLYTFVSEFGEEGQPSDPALQTAPEDGTWTLSNLEASAPDSANRSITHKNIYRTIADPSSGAVDYFFVAQIPIAQTSYADTSATVDIARNDTLDSIFWEPPPEGLLGLVDMPNGYFAAFKGSTLYLSEPNNPHAWPSSYARSTIFPIVGITVVFGQLVVVTQGNPYVGGGIRPDAFSFSKHTTPAPCLSRRSLVPMTDGAYYASPDGIVSYGPNGLQMISRPLMTHTRWMRDYSPRTIQALRHNDQYVGFYSDSKGFVFSFNDPKAAFSELNRFTGVTTFQLDPWTGDAFLIRAGLVEEWDPTDTIPLSYRWVSKEFRFTRPLNMAAIKVEVTPAVDPGKTLEALDPDLAAEINLYNAERFAAGPLAPLNSAPLNAQRQEALPTSSVVQNRAALNASSLIDIDNDLPTTSSVQVNFYVRGQLIASRNMFSGQMYRLPSGYTSSLCRVEIVALNYVTHLALAESGEELKQV